MGLPCETPLWGLLYDQSDEPSKPLLYLIDPMEFAPNHWIWCEVPFFKKNKKKQKVVGEQMKRLGSLGWHEISYPTYIFQFPKLSCPARHITWECLAQEYYSLLYIIIWSYILMITRTASPKISWLSHWMITTQMGVSIQRGNQ